MRYFYYLSKRLFRKKSYLVILALVPILVWAMRYISFQDSGVLKIALYDESDSEIAKEVILSLMNENSVVLFETVDEWESAEKLLKGQKIDAIWIFKDNFDELLKAFAAGTGADAQQPFVIVEREDNVALQLAREKLYGAVAPFLYYYIYEDFVAEITETNEILPSEELQSIYDNYSSVEFFVQFTYIDGEMDEDMNYLVTPLRGMLSLFIVLGGFAATLFFMQDEENGILDCIPFDKRQGKLYVYQFAVTVYIGIAVLFALAFAEISTSIGYEIITMSLFLLMCMGFCSILKLILRSPKRLGLAMVVCMIIMLVLCPVFFNIKNGRIIQYVLPPFYYLSSAHNPGYLKDMAIYCVIAFVGNYLLGKLLHSAS